jgi:hypothetical protein
MQEEEIVLTTRRTRIKDASGNTIPLAGTFLQCSTTVFRGGSAMILAANWNRSSSSQACFSPNDGTLRRLQAAFESRCER